MSRSAAAQARTPGCYGRLVNDDIRPDLSDADFVRLLPKVELHVHLAGTIRTTLTAELRELVAG